MTVSSPAAVVSVMRIGVTVAEREIASGRHHAGERERDVRDVRDPPAP